MFPFGIASRGSFRRQIILTFVVGFFGLAVTFAAFMVANERANLFRNGREAATGLVQSLAVSARAWVLANDVIGMQEVVQAFSEYPDLRYAMIVSPTGLVLAHNDTTKVGQYVADERSLAQLKAQPEQQIMRDDENIIEVALPITVGQRQIGWARVALGREDAQRGLDEFIGSIALFVLVITILFFIAALFMVNRLGRRIGSLIEVAKAVQAGDFAKRVTQSPGQEDEINRLAGSLNLMLDALSRNEAQLRSVSRYTRSLIEASLDPLVTIDSDGKITDLNAATEQATGRSRDELVGTDFSEYFTEPDKARAGYRQVFAQGSVTNYPLAIRHRDGHVSAVLYNASVYRNEEGEVQGVFAAARDISEQQRAVLLRAQLAAIVESSNDAIIGKTLDGTITSWNKGAEKIYGYSAEEVIGKSVTLLAPAAQHAEMHRLLETVRNGGTVANHVTERLRKDGTHIHVALTLSPIRDASGKVGGISTIARDISEQKRMEQERAENLRYFESMDRIDRAMQQAKDLEGMLNDVLGEVLEIFDCDRVGLVYPCDPASPTWQIVMERARPGYSTEPQRGLLPMTEARADSMRWLLEGSGPVQFSPEDDPAHERQQKFGILSFMSMAVRPRIGSAWEFGIHQCTHARVWNTQETRLFEEIARRLADGLSTMLANRDLRVSEQRYRLVFENSPVSIWEEDFSAVKVLLDGLKQQGVTDLDAWFTQHPEGLSQCAQAAKIQDVNSAAIGLHGASSKEALLAGLLDTFTPESFETFRHEMLCLWNGQTQMAEDAVVKTLDGELRYVTVYFTVCPGYEETLGRIIVSLVDITERRRAEEQIRQSEAKYRTLIQNIQAAVVVHAPDTRILISNSQAQEILGLSAEQMLGKTVIDPDWHFFCEDGKPAAPGEYPVNRVLASGQAIRNLVIGVHRPNREADVWVLVNADPVFDKDGSILQVIITFIDITERKQVETNLKRMNERFALATRAASLGVWDWDIQKNKLVWDDRMYALYGIKREDFAGAYDAWLKGVHPDDRIRGDEAIQMALRGEGEFDTEFRVLWPDGSVHIIKAFGQIVRDAEGKPLRMTGINFDITERKQAEEALRASRDEYRRTLDNMMEGCQILGFDWRFLYVNDAVAKHGRRAKEELLGHTMFELYPGIEKSEMFAELRHCMDSRIPVHTENEFAYPDGSKSYFQLSIQPVPEGIFVLSMDITERKLAEEALRREQALLNRIMVTSPVGIAVVSKEGQVTFANPQAERIMGLSKDEITQRSYNAPAWHITAIDGGPFPDEELPFSRVMATRQPVFDVVHAIVWPDGRRVLLSINGAPLFDAQGVIEGVAFAMEDITERTLADERLRRNEHSLAEAQRIAHLGSWHMDLATNEVFWSEELYRIYGLDPSLPPPLFTDSMKLFTPESWERLSNAIARAVETGISYELELETVNKDGGKGWMMARGELVRDEHGKAVGVRGVVMDITERKQAEEKLRSSEHGLSEAQRIAHLGNWELDLEKNVLTWSDEIFRIFEIDPEKFGASYEAFLNAIHPEDRDMVNKAYTDSVNNRVPYDIVHRLLMPDGRIKYINEKCETYFGADGKPIRSVGTVHDITERKQDELALLEQQAHSNSLLHLSRRLERAQSYADTLAAAGDEVREQIGYRNLWVYLLSDDRQYFTALIGTGEEGGRSTKEGGAPRLTIAGDRMLEQIAEAKEIVIIEDAQTSDIVNREMVRKLGNRTIVNIPIILFDRHLGTVGVGTFGDEGVRVPTASEQKYLLALSSHMAAALDRIYLLNERRRAEQEVQELNRDLEQRVTERTEQLEEANKELESFSYSVSHDLRSPLRAIDGFSHILLEDYTSKLDDEGKRMLGIVRDNTQRMGQLIDDILKFSRSGRSEIYAVEVDMAALAREVLDELQIGDSKIANLRCEIGDLPPARCDRALMHQVFANLLSNAIKFSRKNETPKVMVGGAIQGDEIVYHVKDNGAGFDMQYADKLFGVFQRLHSMEEFEGTGIGLAIVKRIVTRHGGRVWAEGKVNQGATVYFAIPAMVES